MDLSGLYIKGTGSYEVKEIAPPSESGQLLANNKFLNWTAGDPDDYIITTTDPSAYVEENTNGLRLVCPVGETNSIRQNILTVGQFYKVKIKVHSITGSIRVYNIAGNYLEINSAGVYELYFQGASNDRMYIVRQNTPTDAVISWWTVEEVPEGYPLLDKGDTYLECTSAGTVAFPSNQAYGEWEWDWYKAADGNVFVAQFMSDDIDIGGNGYQFRITSNEGVAIYEPLSGYNFLTVSSYVEYAVWYRIKFIRTRDGEMSLYIKGGSFGTDDWTLVDVTGGSGSNPVTDNTYTTSEYFLLDLDIGDRISNIIMRKAVSQ